MMTRRDWWTGVAVITFALLFHAVLTAAFPRYIIHTTVTQDRQPGDNIEIVFRLDQWTGKVERSSRFGGEDHVWRLFGE